MRDGWRVRLSCRPPARRVLSGASSAGSALKILRRHWSATVPLGVAYLAACAFTAAARLSQADNRSSSAPPARGGAGPMTPWPRNRFSRFQTTSGPAATTWPPAAAASRRANFSVRITAALALVALCGTSPPDRSCGLDQRRTPRSIRHDDDLFPPGALSQRASAANARSSAASELGKRSLSAKRSSTVPRNRMFTR